MASGCENSLGSIWPDDIYVKCSSTAIIKPNDTSTIFPTMVGWKIRIIRAGSPLWFGNPGDGDPYFDYTALTGEVTWSQLPVNTEKFIIQAYKPAE